MHSIFKALTVSATTAVVCGLLAPITAHAAVATHQIKVHVKSGYCVLVWGSASPYQALDVQLVTQSQQDDWVFLSGTGGTGSPVVASTNQTYIFAIYYAYVSGACSRRKLMTASLTPPGNDGLTYWWITDDKFSPSYN
jgi:hypothetical protein